MNNLTPLLPEARFKPLTAARLEGMITHALSHQQLPQQAQVISFRRGWAQNTAYTAGLAAMAASVLMAFLITPQYTTPYTSSIAQTQSGTDVASSSDVSDLLLLESFGA